jgi:type IV pilus assembly protein PilE
MTPTLSTPVRGFTLLELMIALAVAAVLATLATPGFMEPVRKARRLEAVEALAQVQLAQERWRSRCPCYAANLEAAAQGCPASACAADSGLALPALSRGGLYALALSEASPAGYTLTASAVSGRSQAADGDCARLVVTVRQGVGSHTPASCWSR